MKNILSFIRQEKGGLAVVFAIILPFIISCCALAFDGARIMTKRARLADALNEAALSIATTSSANPTAAEKIRLEKMLKNYVTSYLPNDVIKTSKIDISSIIDEETGKSIPVYSLSAGVTVKTMLPLEVFPAFAPELDLTNGGKARKGLQDVGRPADYVFVVDFSISMDDPSADPSGMTRIQLLRKVVQNITTEALATYPETTFAIVPFEVGVPVLYPGENEFGGVLNGCSIMMVPKKSTSKGLNMETGYDIDYAFWANKSYNIATLKAPANNATKLPYTLNDVNKILDQGRYDYYNKYILSSLKTRDGKTYTFDNLTKAPFNWCTKNSSSATNRAAYSCEKKPEDSIFTAKNQAIIQKEMERARRVFLETTDLETPSNGKSIQNLVAMDIDATLEGMFDEANLITFQKDYINFPDVFASPYGPMCLSSGNEVYHWYNVNNVKHFDWLHKVKRNAYLIEPTNDINVLNKFLTMNVGGATHSSTGLLRAVPEMLKGPNPSKVLIMISDGDDNAQHQPMTNELHINRNVCEKIRQGVKTRTNADSVDIVDIYFISVVDDEAGRKRTKFWADYCTGEDNAVIATDYNAIMEKLVEIMSGYEETGYFYN